MVCHTMRTRETMDLPLFFFFFSVCRHLCAKERGVEEKKKRKKWGCVRSRAHPAKPPPPPPPPKPPVASAAREADAPCPFFLSLPMVLLFPKTYIEAVLRNRVRPARATKND